MEKWKSHSLTMTIIIMDGWMVFTGGVLVLSQSTDDNEINSLAMYVRLFTLKK